MLAHITSQAQITSLVTAICTCSFDLSKVAQATGDKATLKQSQQLQKAVKDALADVSCHPACHMCMLPFV